MADHSTSGPSLDPERTEKPSAGQGMSPTQGDSSEPAPAQSPAPRKKRRWLRCLGLLAGLLLLATGGALGLAWYLTTDSGIRSLILPRLSKHIGVEIAAAHVEWDPLASVTVDDLRIGSSDKPVFQAKKFVAQYDGCAFLRKEYRIGKITVASAALRLNRKSDGSYADLPPALQAAVSSDRHADKSKMQPAGAPVPPVFSLDALEINNLELVYTTPVRAATFRNLQCKAANIKPNSDVSLDLQTQFSVADVPSASSPKDQGLTVSGEIQSVFRMRVDECFLPRAAKGDLSATGLAGKIAGESLDGLSATLKLDLVPSASGPSILKEAQISIQKNGALLTSIGAAGPFDMTRREADLDIQAGPIRSNLLNVWFAAKKIDFLDSSFSYVGHISISKGGDLLTADGKLNANPLNLAAPDLPSGAWKPAAFAAEHTVELNWPQRRAVIARLNLDATQQNKPLLKGALSKPMMICWAEAATADAQMGQADFNLQIFPFDLTAVAPLLGLPAEWKLASGLLEADAKIVAADQGRNLILDGRFQVTRMGLSSPSLKLEDAAIFFDGKVNLKDLKSARFQPSSFRLLKNNKPLLTTTFEGDADLKARSGSGRFKFDAPLPDLLALKPVSNLSVTSGSLAGTVDGNLQADGRISLKAAVAARDLDAAYGAIRYSRLSFNLDANADWASPALKLDGARLTALLGGQPAGAWQGNVMFNTKTSQLLMNYKLQDWKAPVFMPLFAAWLPEKKLRSIELTSQGDLRLDGGTLAFKGSAEVKNLLVESPVTAALKPLNATLSTDLTWLPSGALTLRALALQLDPTPTSKNLFQITGRTTLSPAFSFADLTIRGQSLDLSSYYDQLFPTATDRATSVATNDGTPTGGARGVSPAAPAASAASTPSRDLTLSISADSLKVHNFSVTDLNVPFRQKGDVIQLTDGRLKIGNAPVTFTISTQQDQPKPSFKFEAKVDRLEIAPLVDTFKPALKGRVGGVLTALAQGTGRGLSQNDLEQNLNGILQIAIREAHLEKAPSVRQGLVQLGKYLQSADIANSTLDTVDASGKIAEGRLHTDNLHARGSAVEITLRGDVFFDQRLAMEALLKTPRNVMQKSPLMSYLIPVTSVKQDDWIRLPVPAGVTGTLDDPQIKMDLAKLKPEAVVNTGLNILNDLFGPKKDTKSQPQQQQGQQQQPANQPAKSPIEDIFNGLFKKKK
ncbi:MAG: AsmA-like C-terminal region-containing protein [Verrucomicrobia bacterium]|nr:AsmA-like C-terminal region-containing protein [Verrucomicrobiota bacterium]